MTSMLSSAFVTDSGQPRFRQRVVIRARNVGGVCKSGCIVEPLWYLTLCLCKYEYINCEADHPSLVTSDAT
jgi:hypothetical protein